MFFLSDSKTTDKSQNMLFSGDMKTLRVKAKRKQNVRTLKQIIRFTTNILITIILLIASHNLQQESYKTIDSILNSGKLIKLIKNDKIATKVVIMS